MSKLERNLNSNSATKNEIDNINDEIDSSINKDSINEEEENLQEDTTTADISISNEEFMKQLKILNLSIDTLYVVLLGISLNINYLKGEKIKILDAINKSNLSEGLPDLTKTNRITSIMFLYSSGIFLDINYKAFKEASSVKGNKRNVKLVRRTWKSYLASLLTFIASAISRDNLEP